VWLYVISKMVTNRKCFITIFKMTSKTNNIYQTNYRQELNKFHYLNGFSPLWIRKCFLRSLCVVNSLKQEMQLNVEPLWSLKWARKRYRVLNFLEQSKRPHSYGFSLLWTRRWIFRAYDVRNPLWQLVSSQWNENSPIFRFLKLFWKEKPLRFMKEIQITSMYFFMSFKVTSRCEALETPIILTEELFVFVVISILSLVAVAKNYSTSGRITLHF